MRDDQPRPAPDRNLALDLLRVTEAAAMAGGRWVGRGAKNDADQAAVTAMRTMMSTVAMDGVVVIDEGEKDQAPMLYNGERVGGGTGAAYDVAVDPIDGTTLAAKGSSVNDVTVCILDRPRHNDLVADVRAAGARIQFISDGDVAGALMACSPDSGWISCWASVVRPRGAMTHSSPSPGSPTATSYAACGTARVRR